MGCSSGGVNSPSEPSTQNFNVSGHPYVTGSNRSILATGSIRIDTENLSAAFLPNRELAKHWDVTPMLMPPHCNDCVKIEVLQFKPAHKYIKLKISVKNPTDFTGYDVRGIAIVPSDDVRLLNADAYTDLWDDGGAVTRNPFRTFATDWPNHEILPHTGHSRIYEFTYSNFSQLAGGTQLIVDASWPGHCKEAWDIQDQDTSGDLAPNPDASILVTCIVKDWQSDWAGVVLDLSALGFPSKIPMHGGDGVYWVFIFNQFSMPPGDYQIWLEAVDSQTSVRLYDELKISVTAEAPSNFTLKPGEVFVEASWDWPELSAYVSEYHLYKREKGDEYDYQNPIIVPPDQNIFPDDDVLAGHMYFYKLSIAYPLAESELTEEHGAKPFKWGPIVQVSDSPYTSMWPEIARGWDGSVWACWNFGWVEDLDDLITPDWNVGDYGTTLPGDPKNPVIGVDGNGYVHILGADDIVSSTLRYIKCDPYDGGVLIDKHIVWEMNSYNFDMSVGPDNVAHVIYLDNQPGFGTAWQVYHVTVDPDGIVSDPEMVSQGIVGDELIYKCWRISVYAGMNGTIHFSWGKDLIGGPDTWAYRALTISGWENEEQISPGFSGGVEYNLFEDPSGNVYFSENGYFYYFRDENGIWEGMTIYTTYPIWWEPGGGWVSGDDDGNIFHIWTWGRAGEVTYRQHYGTDWSDEHQLTTGHDDPTGNGPKNDEGRVVADKDGLAVAIWMDTKSPMGSWEIFMCRQIME